VVPASNPTTTTVEPASGPKQGGTQVTLTSAALFPADKVTCTFGSLAVPGSVSISGAVQPGNAAQLLLLLRLSCITPPADASVVQLRVTLVSGSISFSLETQFLFYNEQRIVELEGAGGLTINPPWIDVSGRDNITLHGDSLFSLADRPKLRISEALRLKRRLLTADGSPGRTTEQSLWEMPSRVVATEIAAATKARALLTGAPPYQHTSGIKAVSY
jgi:hypothetical protein